MTDTDFNREKMEYDLVIVGARPSGLSAAINFKKIASEMEKTIQFAL